MAFWPFGHATLTATHCVQRSTYPTPNAKGEQPNNQKKLGIINMLSLQQNRYKSPVVQHGDWKYQIG
ncbi:MAG: hypothetical protein F6K65_20655 [Moorea sp. SIO3C2]|nr:hypothetical protein [Moorena sp. SIO3C2]